MSNITDSQAPNPKKDGLYNMISKGNQMAALLKRFGNTPFTERNQGFKYAAIVVSFCINILSIAGAFYGLYWLAMFVSSYPLVTSVLCVVLLVAKEWGKRKSSDNFWDIYHFKNEIVGGWLALSFILFSISAGLTALGTYQSIKAYAPEAVLITTDSLTLNLEAQIAVLDQNIEDAKSTKWKGTTTTDATRNIKTYNRQKTPLLEALTARKLKIADKNENLETVQTATVEQVAFWMIVIYLILEIIFEGCMCFCSYFDMRKMLEDCQDNPDAAVHILSTYKKTAPAVFPNQLHAIAASKQDEDIRMMLKQIQENQKQTYKQPVVVKPFQNQTGATKQAKQTPPPTPETPRGETAETVVAQHFQPETAPLETSQRNDSNPVTKTIVETETEVVFETVDEKYLRQKYKVAWRRLKTQTNKATPTKNRDEIGKQLKDLGYRIFEIDEPRDVIFKAKNGSYFGNKRLIELYKNEI